MKYPYPKVHKMKYPWGMKTLADHLKFNNR